MSTKKIVIYHANCPDGFCAAWIARKMFGDEAEYISANYGSEPPNVMGKEVYILDFSYPRNVMFKMVGDSGGCLTVLDHHKTAEEALRGFANECTSNNIGIPNVIFDMNKSGGRLTWEFFFPEEKPPWLVEYTEDRDLWRFAFSASKEINAGLSSYPREFEVWDRLEHFDRGIMASQGLAILRYQDQLIESVVKNAREIEIAGFKILAANSSMLFSEIAGKLAEGRPFGAVWFQRGDCLRQWSLRSSDRGEDVSAIAKRYGGGEHRNAAGFQDTMQETKSK